MGPRDSGQTLGGRESWRRPEKHLQLHEYHYKVYHSLVSQLKVIILFQYQYKLIILLQYHYNIHPHYHYKVLRISLFSITTRCWENPSSVSLQSIENILLQYHNKIYRSSVSLQSKSFFSGTIRFREYPFSVSLHTIKSAWLWKSW